MELNVTTRCSIAELTRSASVGVALLAAGPALADDCFSGGSDSGFIEFRGAVEGSGFTGRFEDFDVRYCMPAGAPAEGSIEVAVRPASAESGNNDRDETLVGPEFFHVERFPEATWSSTAIREAADGYEADGELTLRDITAAQSIAFELTPDGEAMVAAGEFAMAGTTEIERLRFDIGTGEFADPEFVRNRVDLRFEVRLTADPD
ncbi:YceI family protein [Halomonas denitrificans]|nr:YceI family protein [Halomonas denitrificans]